MRWLFLISFLFFLSPVFPQETPSSLAKQLTASCKTEREKVTAIFQWITENIAYKTKPDNKKLLSGANAFRNAVKVNEVLDDGPLKSLQERVAETVLQKREAVCDGYARLFTTICDYAGIRSVIIMGFARTAMNMSAQRFAVNHYWNAVLINEKWYLLDATWASGYVSLNRGEFVREYEEKYFLASPEIFIQDHYPDDARWTLLPDSEIPNEFYRSPFKQKSFVKYQFKSFYPAVGIIDAFVGDTIRLSLESDIKRSGRNISPDLLVDSSLFSHSPTWVFLRPDRPEPTALPNLSNYSYTVASPDVEWLYLLYNDDLVLRYKINVKKKKA